MVDIKAHLKTIKKQLKNWDRQTSSFKEEVFETIPRLTLNELTVLNTMCHFDKTHIVKKVIDENFQKFQFEDVLIKSQL